MSVDQRPYAAYRDLAAIREGDSDASIIIKTLVMIEVFRWFRFLPLFAAPVLVLTFVWPCARRGWARSVWAAFLITALLMFEGFFRLGGILFRPELPEKIIWIWCVAYLGSLLLAALAVTTFLLRSRRKVWALPVVAYGIAALGLWNALKVPTVTEITLSYENLPRELDGYRIVQISDLHACAAARGWRTRAIVEKANALSPDLICLTGDIADGSPADRYVDVTPLKELRAKDGVFAASGNHEAFYDFAEWKKVYATWGIRFLENDCVYPRRSLALAGVNDILLAKKGFTPPDISAAFSSATNNAFRVLLQHRPNSALENFATHNLDLQLSGHTHGGFMPGLWHLTAECNRGFLRGNYSLGHKHLIVSSGCGPWPAFPFRYFTPSEIILIRLENEKRCAVSNDDSEDECLRYRRRQRIHRMHLVWYAISNGIWNGIWGQTPIRMLKGFGWGTDPDSDAEK